jgi:hypothetical protein
MSVSKVYAKSVCGMVLLASVPIWTMSSNAKGRSAMSEHHDACLSMADPKSEMVSFVADIWPTLHQPHDVLVNTTLALPRDLTRNPVAQRPQSSAEPPFLDPSSLIWTVGWGSGERPPAEVVESWLSAQTEQRIDCDSGAKARWGVRTVSAVDAAAMTSTRKVDSQSANIIRIGMPAFSRSGKLALLRHSVSGPGLSGEDMLVLYRKDEGRWREAGRTTLGQY